MINTYATEKLHHDGLEVSEATDQSPTSILTIFSQEEQEEIYSRPMGRPLMPCLFVSYRSWQ